MEASDAVELSSFFDRADQIYAKQGELTYLDAVEYIARDISVEFQRKEMAKRIADAIFMSANKSHEEKLSMEEGKDALEHAMEEGAL